MDFKDLYERLRLPFREDKELRQSLCNIIGFYPNDISYYKTALTHKSSGQRNEKGKPLHNERLEFLGDALLDAVVGHIVFDHFEGKREGFLTNTRSKLVSRESLGKLADEMGLTDLIKSGGQARAHNSYMAGNAFEALVGAIYLDQGYAAVMRFMKKRILEQMVNIDKVAYKEVNFKSKLLEWTQKNRVSLEYELQKQGKDTQGSPVFSYQVMIEGVKGGSGEGFSVNGTVEVLPADDPDYPNKMYFHSDDVDAFPRYMYDNRGDAHRAKYIIENSSDVYMLLDKDNPPQETSFAVSVTVDSVTVRYSADGHAYDTIHVKAASNR
jgi:ribonuclease III